MRISKGTSEGLAPPEKAGTISTPGAVMSGFKISGVIVLGPLEEKLATNEASLTIYFGDVAVIKPSRSVYILLNL